MNRTNLIKIVLLFAVVAYDIPLLRDFLSNYITISMSTVTAVILLLSLVPIAAIVSYSENKK